MSAATVTREQMREMPEGPNVGRLLPAPAGPSPSVSLLPAVWHGGGRGTKPVEAVQPGPRRELSTRQTGRPRASSSPLLSLPGTGLPPRSRVQKEASHISERGRGKAGPPGLGPL